MERAEELFLQRFGKADFGGKAVAEIGGHVVAVHPLRGGGEAEKNLRGEMVEDGAIAASGAVVGLVHHDIIVEAAPHLLPELAGGKHADRAEQMLQASRLKGADLQFAKILVTQDVAEGA